MLIHFSDTHGKLPEIPRAHRNPQTRLVLSGDICPNFLENFTPGIGSGNDFQPTSWRDFWNFRKIDVEAEAIAQNLWVEEKLLPHLKANNIDINNVVVIRGNHDWADFEKYFPNALNTGSKTIDFKGSRIGLLCGSLWFTGEWQDEINESEMDNRIHRLDKDIKILISHQPPYNIKDRGHGEDRIGSQSIYAAIFGKSVFDEAKPYFEELRLVLFGHAHQGKGTVRHNIGEREVRFYNAAQSRFTLEGDI